MRVARRRRIIRVGGRRVIWIARSWCIIRLGGRCIVWVAGRWGVIGIRLRRLIGIAGRRCIVWIGGKDFHDFSFQCGLVLARRRYQRLLAMRHSSQNI